MPPRTIASLHTMPDASIGTSAPPRSNVFHSAAASGVSKHTSGVCAVGSQLVRCWGEEPTSDFPRCGEHENARYVWTCQEPAVSFVWALLMSTFSKWLQSVHTAKDFTYWIIQRLTKWGSSEPFSNAQSNMPGLLQAIDAL